MQIAIARNAQQLAAHLAAWDDLAAHAIEPNVFYESWHLRPALRVFGKGTFRFVFIYQNVPHQKPILCGFFPLQRRRRYKGLPLHVLSLWKHDYCSLCTPLVRAGYEDECLDAFWQWITQKSGAALLEMHQVGADGPFVRHWTQLLQKCAAPHFADAIYARAFLNPQTSSADEYLHNALSRKRRKEWKRLENRLSELGHLRYEWVKDNALGQGIEQGIEEFLQLEASGWKGRAATAFANDEIHSAFFQEVACEASLRGRLMLLSLKLNGRPIAMKFNLLADNGAFACKIAYDEEFSSFSPGVLLELENIRLVQETPALQWMDSCAIPDHSMINRLWTERRSLQNSLVSTGKMSGNLIVALLPILRFVKAQCKQKRWKRNKEKTDGRK